MVYKVLMTAALCFLTLSVHAQAVDSSYAETPVNSKISIEGAVDVYYGYDFSEPLARERLYTTQAYRHNEFNLNWGYIRARYATERVRATLALQTGTYVRANYAAEPDELTRLIAQANAGVKLGEGVWLDMGILPSHIGYESTFSGDNEIYTRALMAENSPYYETGAQSTTKVSEKLTMKFLVLNGWQNIAETNDAKSLGFGMTYNPNGKTELSYNSYYGNEAPDGGEAKRRYFHNVYASYAVSESLSLAGSVDYGRQELWGSDEKGSWWAAMIIGRYQLSKRIALASRVEHYNDSNQIIVLTDTSNGFQTSSASLNFDYVPAPNFLVRFEARGYDSKDNVFVGEGGYSERNALLVTSLSFKF